MSCNAFFHWNNTDIPVNHLHFVSSSIKRFLNHVWIIEYSFVEFKPKFTLYIKGMLKEHLSLIGTIPNGIKQDNSIITKKYSFIHQIIQYNFIRL